MKRPIYKGLVRHTCSKRIKRIFVFEEKYKFLMYFIFGSNVPKSKQLWTFHRGQILSPSPAYDFAVSTHILSVMISANADWTAKWWKRLGILHKVQFNPCPTTWNPGILQPQMEVYWRQKAEPGNIWIRVMDCDKSRRSRQTWDALLQKIATENSLDATENSYSRILKTLNWETHSYRAQYENTNAKLVNTRDR